MVTSFEEWKRAVYREALKLREAEEWLSAAGIERMKAFDVLDDLSVYAADAADMLTWIADDRKDLSGYEIEQLESPHLSQAIRALHILADHGQPVTKAPDQL